MKRQDTLYYNLFQAIETGVCPICYWINHFVDRYFESMLYELVNDYGLREQLNKSWGFCREHAYRLMTMGDPLGHAIIYTGLFDYLMDEFRYGVNRQIKPMKLQNKLKQTDCPACVNAQETEMRYVAGFIESLNEEEFRLKYQNNPGLCIPHFLKSVFSCGNQELVCFIRDTQLAYMRDLSNKLKEIIRKSDYRFTDEPIADEKDAWIRAVYLLVGDKTKRRKGKLCNE